METQESTLSTEQGEDTPPTDSTSEDQIAQRLQQTVQKSMQDSREIGTLLADPLVRDVLKARQEGRDVSLVSKEDQEQQKEAEPPTPPEDWEDLNNHQLASAILDQVKHQVGSIVSDKLSDAEGRVGEKLASLQQWVRGNEENRQVKAIEECRKKFSDFDKFKEKMVDLDKSFGEGKIPVERLYLLAKVESGSPVTPESMIATEKPQHEGIRQVVSLQDRKDPVAPGVKGFRQLLDRVEINPNVLAGL